MSGRKSTAIELVEDLRKLDQTPAIQRIIRRAEVGHYHDYLTDAACPKVELVNDLRSAKPDVFALDPVATQMRVALEALANAVMRGEWDEDPGDKRLPRVES